MGHKLYHAFERVKIMLYLTYSAYKAKSFKELAVVLENKQELSFLEKQISAELINQTNKDPSFAKAAKIYLLIPADLVICATYINSLINSIKTKWEGEISFSQQAQSDLDNLFNLILKLTEEAEGFFKENAFSAEEERLAAVIKEEISTYRKKHIDRLLTGVCNPRAGEIFLDMVDFLGQIAFYIHNACHSLVKANSQK